VTVAIRVRDYDQLRAALAARRRSLGLRQLEADEKSGLQSGYVGKIGAGTRKLGDLSLPTGTAPIEPAEPRTGSAGRVRHLLLTGETP
jgi:hypothetical protein